MADPVIENEELNNDYKSEVSEKKSFFERVADVFKRQKLLNPGNEVKVQRTGMSIDFMMRMGEFRANTVNFANSIVEKTSDLISKITNSGKESDVKNTLQPEVISKESQDIAQEARSSEDVKENQIISPIIPKTIVGQTHSKEEVKAKQEALTVEEIEVDELEQEIEQIQDEKPTQTAQIEVGTIDISAQEKKKNEGPEMEL